MLLYQVPGHLSGDHICETCNLISVRLFEYRKTFSLPFITLIYLLHIFITEPAVWELETIDKPDIVPAGSRKVLHIIQSLLINCRDSRPRFDSLLQSMARVLSITILPPFPSKSLELQSGIVSLTPYTRNKCPRLLLLFPSILFSSDHSNPSKSSHSNIFHRPPLPRNTLSTQRFTISHREIRQHPSQVLGRADHTSECRSEHRH